MAMKTASTSRRRSRWPWLAAVVLPGAVAGAALSAVRQPARPLPRKAATAICPACDTGLAAARRLASGQARAPVPAVRAAHRARPASPAGMVWIPGGEFWMGCDDPTTPDARPFHRVRVSAFWMDKTEVTNQQFARFVRATGYVTVAERKPDPRDFPGAPPENLVPGSLVFTPPEGAVPLQNAYVWWRYVPGASWRHPEGPASDLHGREKHPVVQIAWKDAAAYARWAGKRLPTEAEWEIAARGGLEGKRYCWGDARRPGGKWPANLWQGHFPDQNRVEDGFRGTAPVASFPPNGYGLYDMAGNVWEWCADWYRPDSYALLAAGGKVVWNPQGPKESLDPREPGIPKRVQRGGSFLCCDHYCSRYLPGSRGKGAVDSGASHLGFRCVRSTR
jgi:sulfatase modifying factor 1